MKDNLSSALTWGIAALGVSAEPDHFVAGLFFALAAGFGAFVARPEQGRGEVWAMVLLAVVGAITIAIAHPTISFLQGLPVQFCMGVVGFFSRPTATLLMNVSDRLVARSDDLTDKVIDRVSGDKSDD